MASRSNLVNLDAMIQRADFAALSDDEPTPSTYSPIPSISLRDFAADSLIEPILRKPDFQRETNHWSPDQVVSLLECFISGDLIPSVILWQSPAYLFVIDGGHRLSVLKAWIHDDYGDGLISQPYFGYHVSNEQKNSAKKVRDLLRSKNIVSYKEFLETKDSLDATTQKHAMAIRSRALPIQWVAGDANKAESSFFKINTKGTSLDDIEELLLRNRKKSVSIAARAIIRAGKGHRYWSAFERELGLEIENLAQELHSTLFDPELKRKVKTLNLPLGGSNGVRSALQSLIDIALIAIKDQQETATKIANLPDDSTGKETIEVLRKTLRLAKRVTGNDGGSLGLHPAVYFYGPTGQHSNPMFMGTMALIGKVLSNNDKNFFVKFAKVRGRLENILVEQKYLISTILQKHVSNKRVDKYASLIEQLIDHLCNNNSPSEADLVKMAGLEGKIVVGSYAEAQTEFSDDTKNGVFITAALNTALKCPICSGYIDVEKSVSYDHVKRAREGGQGAFTNCQLTHPYCNQSAKN